MLTYMYIAYLIHLGTAKVNKRVYYKVYAHIYSSAQEGSNKRSKEAYIYDESVMHARLWLVMYRSHIH